MPPPRHRLAAFCAKLNSIVAPLRRSFTYAQGKEMSRHQALDAASGVKVYFCELHLAVATRHLQKR
jgi:IS30 family transposase